MNPHEVTQQFEKAICDYTGAPYCVALENGWAAMYMALMFEGVKDRIIAIPKHTYMSVPNAIIQAGAKIRWIDTDPILKGWYLLVGTKCIDSALTFDHDMYIPDTFMCLSFTGAYKHLKLGKGGAILTDSEKAYNWFKRKRFNGRRELSYHEDTFDMLGWNFYMNPMIAAQGILQMQQFYYMGEPIKTEDKRLPYPDLSIHEAYKPYTVL